MTKGTLMRSAAWSNWVKSRRLELGLRQYEFADVLGVSPTYVSRWERSSWVPSYHTCVAVAQALGLDKTTVLKAAGYVGA